jgi:DNA adenine methylase
VEKLSGWIIYCDPPYGDSSNSGFNSDDESDDEKNGKDEASESFDSTKFWKWARRTSVHNLVFVSEYTAPKDFISVHDRNIKATNKVGYDKSRCEHLYIHKKWWKVVNS